MPGLDPRILKCSEKEESVATVTDASSVFKTRGVRGWVQM